MSIDCGGLQKLGCIERGPAPSGVFHDTVSGPIFPERTVPGVNKDLEDAFYKVDMRFLDEKHQHSEAVLLCNFPG